MEALTNEQGQSVYPTAAGAFMDDPKNVYSDDEYNRIKNGGSQSPMETSAQSTEAPQVEDQQQSAASVEAATVETSTAAASEPEKQEAFDADKFLSELTGGKVTKKEELLAKLEEKPSLEFANDTSRKIADALREGKTDEVLDILNKQKLITAAEQGTDEFRIKLKMQLENPEWEGVDIDDEYDRLYGMTIDPALSDPAKVEREQRRIERSLKAAGKDALDFLAAQKEGLVFPEFGSNQPSVDDIPEVKAYKELQAELESTNKSFFEAIDKDISNLGVIDLSVNDKDVQFTHQFQIADDEKAALAESAKDYWKEFQKTYHGDDGWNAKKLMQDQYIVKNLSKIIKSAVTAAKTQESISVVKNLANADNSSQGVAPDLNAEAVKEATRAFILA